MDDKRRKLTAEQIDQISSLRAAGLTYNQIALAFGVLHTTIMYYVKIRPSLELRAKRNKYAADFRYGRAQRPNPYKSRVIVEQADGTLAEIVTLPDAPPEQKPPGKYDHLLFEPINEGRNYEEYLKEPLNRAVYSEGVDNPRQKAEV